MVRRAGVVRKEVIPSFRLESTISDAWWSRASWGVRAERLEEYGGAEVDTQARISRGASRGWLGLAGVRNAFVCAMC